jgi:putative methanogenesis marker 16 metalloprotein
MKQRSLDEIKKKISDGSAVVMTAQELCQLTQTGKKISFDDVDVVTTATKGLMSGTSCIMAFRVGEPGQFSRVKKLTMNDIECHVGPCPNEYLGLVDLIIYATDHSESNPKYGAGHLLRELVEGKPVEVKCTTVEGSKITKKITIQDIYFAKMLGIRHAFRNYNSFINPSDKPIKSIFTVLDLQGNNSQITFCGCGPLNPLENDVNMDVIGIGTPVLINGAIGHVIGAGTRATPDRPNLMTITDLYDMNPEYMGGFVTSCGPEVIVSIGVALPIINEQVFNNLKLTDKNVPLNIVDIVGRKPLAKIDYGQVWKRNIIVNLKEGYRNAYCNKCESKSKCPVEEYCPTNAFSIQKGIDRTYCFNCGTCIRICSKMAFNGDLGSVEFNGKQVPITLRQSDRSGAIKLMNELKKKVQSGEFPLILPVAKPKIRLEKPV